MKFLLKLTWSHIVYWFLEYLHLINIAKYGSIPYSLTHTPILNKLLTYHLLHQLCHDVEFSDWDNAASFDQFLHHLVVFVIQRMGLTTLMGATLYEILHGKKY